MVLLVFRVPEAPAVGPGRCVCRWAAARPRDRHTRACGSEWSISRPALALPPPTGTAAWPSGPSGSLHTGAAALLMCGWVSRLEARPGLATTHGRRSLALRSLRRPPIGRGLGLLLGNFACNSPGAALDFEL